MSPSFREIQAPNGTVLAYSLFGSGLRKAIFFHGHPGSRDQAEFLGGLCEAEGIELLAFDRPGYGNSPPLPPGASPLDLSLAVAALADAEGWSSFHLLGVSGGAPYALKTASLLKERTLSVHLVCGLGPLHEREIGALFPRKLYWALHGAHHLPAPLLNTIVRSRLRVLAAKGMPRRRPDFLSPADFALIQSPEVLPRLRKSMNAAFRQGVAGSKRDIQAFLAPWELDWQAVSCPVNLWHGLEDKMVPWQFSEILAKRLPQGRFIPCEGEGHYTLPIQQARLILKGIPGF